MPHVGRDIKNVFFFFFTFSKWNTKNFCVWWPVCLGFYEWICLFLFWFWCRWPVSHTIITTPPSSSSSHIHKVYLILVGCYTTRIYCVSTPLLLQLCEIIVLRENDLNTNSNWTPVCEANNFFFNRLFPLTLRNKNCNSSGQ